MVPGLRAPAVPASTPPTGGPLLADTKLTDLYIRLDPPGFAIYRPKSQGGRSNPVQVPKHHMAEVEEIRKKLLSTDDKQDWGVVHHALRWRARLQRMVGNEMWAALRPTAPRPWRIERLGIENEALAEMAALGSRPGLIIIAGATGDGKSTTAASLLDHWLETIGGIAFTAEDPVEFDLSRPRANGSHAWQMEVDDDNGWETALKSALRWHPDYIYLGETRTARTAVKLLRLAASGHTCMTTVHASSPTEAVNAIIHLADEELRGSAGARVASCLSGVVHQKMSGLGRPFARLLITQPGEGCPFRGIIRDNRFEQIDTFLDQQEIRIFGARRSLESFEAGHPQPLRGVAPGESPRDAARRAVTQREVSLRLRASVQQP